MKNIRMSEEEVFPDVTIALLRQWTRKLGFTPEQLADELVKALRAIQLERLASTIHEGIYLFRVRRALTLYRMVLS